MVTEAKRGYIYEYDDDKFDGVRYVLVISSDTRATDKMVNTLMLGDSNLGHDVVSITNDIFGTKYVHCGMLTYSRRAFLTKEVCKISDEEMENIENTLCRELSLREYLVAEKNFYKKMYKDLLNKLVNEK